MCDVCYSHRDEALIVTCSCAARSHIYCLDPPLFDKPRSWSCLACSSVPTPHSSPDSPYLPPRGGFGVPSHPFAVRYAHTHLPMHPAYARDMGSVAPYRTHGYGAYESYGYPHRIGPVHPYYNHTHGYTHAKPEKYTPPNLWAPPNPSPGTSRIRPRRPKTEQILDDRDVELIHLDTDSEAESEGEPHTIERQRRHASWRENRVKKVTENSEEKARKGASEVLRARQRGKTRERASERAKEATVTVKTVKRTVETEATVTRERMTRDKAMEKRSYKGRSSRNSSRKSAPAPLSPSSSPSAPSHIPLSPPSSPTRHSPLRSPPRASLTEKRERHPRSPPVRKRMRMHWGPVGDVDSHRTPEKACRKAQDSKSTRPQSDLDALSKLPGCPVFYPSVQEFVDPLAYIRRIRKQCENYGLCRVVPPPCWRPPFQVDPDKYEFSTMVQEIHKLQEATGFDQGKHYVYNDYKTMADKFKKDWIKNHHPMHRGTVPPSLIERDYWEILNKQTPIKVEYGNDIDSSESGSGFPDSGTSTRIWKTVKAAEDKIEDGRVAEEDQDNSYPSCPAWNLNVLPLLKGSVVRHLARSVSGVSVPWVYMGMLFSSFCWHAEDDFLSSINYLHSGASKQWYGVPGAEYDAFEKVMKTRFSHLFDDQPDLLYKLITMLPPTALVDAGVHVYKTRQEAGQFIVTFPRAFHAGFNHGFNCAEAVNFATDDWFPHGRAAVERYRKCGRQSVLSRQQLLLMCAINEPHLHNINTLRDEIALLRCEEEKLRKSVVERGVQRVKRLDDASLDKVELEQAEMSCAKCKQFCYLSYLRCPEHSGVVCLEHATSLCACSLKKAVLYYRLTIQDLSRLGQRLKKRQEKDMRKTQAHTQTHTQTESSRRVKRESGGKQQTVKREVMKTESRGSERKREERAKERKSDRSIWGGEDVIVLD